MDIRSTGKDLIRNHLPFVIYNHAAFFEPDLWPLPVRANGYLMLSGTKMGKSTGNFMTLHDSLNKFGGDATRLALADAGDSIVGANFEEHIADAAILRLYTLIKRCEETMSKVRGEASDSKLVKIRTGGKEAYSFHDKVFEQEIADSFIKTKYLLRGCLKDGFYELQSTQDWYREVTIDTGMHAALIELFVRTSALLIQPIAPHFSEHIWKHVLQEPTTAQNTLWPTPPTELDQTILDAAAYMRGIMKMIRDADISLRKSCGKRSGDHAGPALQSSDPKSVRVIVARQLPGWKATCVGVVESLWRECTAIDEARLMETLEEKGLTKKMAMPFVHAFQKRLEYFGPEIAFAPTLPFDEVRVLRELVPYMKHSLGYVDVEVTLVVEAQGKTGPGYNQVALDGAEPGAPGFVF